MLEYNENTGAYDFIQDDIQSMLSLDDIIDLYFNEVDYNEE